VVNPHSGGRRSRPASPRPVRAGASLDAAPAAEIGIDGRRSSVARSTSSGTAEPADCEAEQREKARMMVENRRAAVRLHNPQPAATDDHD
jgi:hypothetical protein